MKRTQRAHNRKRLVACIGLILCPFLFSSLSTVGAQSEEKQAYAFRGTVEKVDANAKTVTINKVEGRLKTASDGGTPLWVLVISQAYKFDKPEMLSRVRAGDQIAATVYAGDFQTLFDVQVVAPKSSQNK